MMHEIYHGYCRLNVAGFTTPKYTGYSIEIVLSSLTMTTP